MTISGIKLRLKRLERELEQAKEFGWLSEWINMIGYPQQYNGKLPSEWRHISRYGKPAKGQKGPTLP